MTSPRTLLEALSQGAARGDRYAIRAAINGSFVARAPSSRACLLVPTRPGTGRPVGRVSGSLSMHFPPSVLFAVGGREWEAPCAVVECLDESLLGAFCALSMDVAERLTRDGRTPVPADVITALADWERLLRSRRRLSEEEELGLWGELRILERMPDLDAAVRCWRGPFGAAVDFLANEIGVEVKTSRKRLQHHFSLTQLDRPLGDLPVYFVSAWIGIDSEAGATLGDLVSAIAGRTSEPVAFERALLACGFTLADSSLYTTRFTLLEPPVWFPPGAIPRVREIDSGVSHVRYVAQLDELRALEEVDVAALMSRLVAT